MKKMEIQILKPDICRFSTAPNDRDPFPVNCEGGEFFFFFGIGCPEKTGEKSGKISTWAKLVTAKHLRIIVTQLAGYHAENLLVATYIQDKARIMHLN